MKVSQLIQDLQRVLENEGDLRVYVDAEDDVGFYAIELAVENRVPPAELIIREKEFESN